MDEQEIHQKVVEDSAQSYLKVTEEQDVMVNRADSRQFAVGGLYPDVVIRMKTGETVMEIVETESTVNPQQVEKWRQFAALGHEFKLIVPLSKIEEAKNLTSGVPNINVQAYEVVDGQIHWFGQR